jgi:hypothetical protein
MLKGDTLKEMDYIQKAGIKYLTEAVVIYSLKQAMPGTSATSLFLYAQDGSQLGNPFSPWMQMQNQV